MTVKDDEEEEDDGEEDVKPVVEVKDDDKPAKKPVEKYVPKVKQSAQSKIKVVEVFKNFMLSSSL
jgi:hypothetical protein